MEKIEVKNISFKYHVRTCKAIKNVSFSVYKGEFLTLCGQSGCGKTTLLRLLKASISPFGETEGEIDVDGVNVITTPIADESFKIGFVMQSPENQIVTDKVWHELAFGLENH